MEKRIEKILEQCSRFGIILPEQAISALQAGDYNLTHQILDLMLRYRNPKPGDGSWLVVVSALSWACFHLGMGNNPEKEIKEMEAIFASPSLEEPTKFNRFPVQFGWEKESDWVVQESNALKSGATRPLMAPLTDLV